MDNTLISNQPVNLLRAKGLEIFHRKGYYGTSDEELFEKLMISREEFKSHFTSKEDFFIGILENLVLQRMQKFLIEPLSHKQSPFPLILEAFGNAINVAIANESDRGSMLGNFINEFAGKNVRISKHLRDIIRIWEVNIISLLKKGMNDGFINPHVDCEAAADFILASYFGTRTLMTLGNKTALKHSFNRQLSSYFYSLARTE
ncbi:TetR/AcrR family transcriptional regulator [Croceivirga thetidis]|uniref:TetR/AcrR family transcriptional regulator n=1 Tax=Croceivirga thetidis TaxID=2721623 RepID=A0ABX1GNG4_9FLAO|nr:TetR/AcrR family transcriptional regulator [Croceivirga thetidis]NKI31184.1 TetR/AcrR family transcriptional regulator [Croceivirga thetidis]